MTFYYIVTHLICFYCYFSGDLSEQSKGKLPKSKSFLNKIQFNNEDHDLATVPLHVPDDKMGSVTVARPRSNSDEDTQSDNSSSNHNNSSLFGPNQSQNGQGQGQGQGQVVVHNSSDEPSSSTAGVSSRIYQIQARKKFKENLEKVCCLSLCLMCIFRFFCFSVFLYPL